MNIALLCMIAIVLKDNQEELVMWTLAAQSAGGTWIPLLVVYALIFGVFWFIFIRPQKKEQKRVQAMIADMEVGDTVLTTSGFYGVVIDISETDVIVEFGNNKNCRIPMQKAAIMQVEKPGAQKKKNT